MKLACLFVCLTGAWAQDPDLKRQIDAETRTVYDKAQTRVFRLASTCAPGWRLCEITGFYTDDALVRVVVAGWEDRGRRAVRTETGGRGSGAGEALRAFGAASRWSEIDRSLEAAEDVLGRMRLAQRQGTAVLGTADVILRR